MSTYLEDYLEKIRGLPPQVQRNLNLIKDLDENVFVMTHELKEIQKAYLENVKDAAKKKSQAGTEPDAAKIAADKEALKVVKEKQYAAVQLAEEKIAAANQAYDLIDSYIRMLDSDLRSFEETLRLQGLYQDPEGSTGGGAYEGSTVSGGEPEPAPRPAQQAATIAKKQPSGEKRKRDSTQKKAGTAAAPITTIAPVLGALTEEPVDPDEPKYCHCQRISFGDMVACENEECPIEWFHFPCVGLKEQPKGTWYCSDACREKSEGKRIRPA